MATAPKYLDYKPKDKLDGLLKFKEKGYFLVDSTYEQIDKIKTPKKRNRVIVANIPNLVNDLEDIVQSKRVKIIPIKKNVCQILSGPLESVGFKVLNQSIPFPYPGQFKIFFEKLNYLKEEYRLP